jgi:hypothetical protein
MIELLSPRQIDQMRPAGRFVADVLAQLRDRVEPGVKLLDIDAWTGELIGRHNARSCYVDYTPAFGRGPFGKVICTSVNDAVLHGYRMTTPFAMGTCSVSTSRRLSTDGLPTVRSPSSSAIPEASGISRPPSVPRSSAPATASTLSSADMAWAGPCIRTRTYPTLAGRAGDSSYAQDSCSLSSPG